MKPSENITWLSSYPKSGNTWFRTILSNLRAAKQANPVNINELRFECLNSASRDSFENILGINASELPRDTVDQLRVKLFKYWSTKATERLFIKTHDLFRHLPSGESLFEDEVMHSVLYFIRNPLDIVASFANHEVLSFDEIIDFMLDKNAVFSNNELKGHKQVSQFFSSWDQHVQSWNNATPKVLCLKYEDMISQPENTFGRALTHIKLDFDDALIREAIAKSAFQLLSQQEEESGFLEKKPSSPFFFRKGMAGGWREELTNSQAQRIIDEFGATMEILGYPTSLTG